MDGKLLISIQDVTVKVLPYPSLSLTMTNALADSQTSNGSPLPRLSIKLIIALSCLI